MSRTHGYYNGTDSDNFNRSWSENIFEEAPKRKSSAKHTHERYFESFNLGYYLQIGQLARENERFCSFQVVKRYPYIYIGNANRKRVDDKYFNQGKLYDYPWEYFYLHRPSFNETLAPLVLVTTRQLNHFLASINDDLKTSLAIPRAAKGAFEVVFKNKSTPRPRYLGRASNKAAADELQHNIPTSNFRLDGEKDTSQVVTQECLDAFQEKITLIIHNIQNKSGNKKVNHAKNNESKLRKKKEWKQSIRRVQRYLGLRQPKDTPQDVIPHGVQNSELSGKDGSNIIEVATELNSELLTNDANNIIKPATEINPKPLANDNNVETACKEIKQHSLSDLQDKDSFAKDQSVVFVCVDVEAWEHDLNIITEIGFASLDTRDISSVAPGEGGANWVKFIHARHFRIKDNESYINGDFVSGCAERFEFGTSEFIDLKDAPHVISKCFNNPLSRSENLVDEEPKRKIVIVGHDINADIKFLKRIGYDIYDLPNLLELVDTVSIFRIIKRETNARSLGSIMNYLGVVAWNLHNAGNDAYYTLQAMILLSIHHFEQKKLRDKSDLGSRKKDTHAAGQAQDDGWSSSGNSSDGGSPQLNCDTGHDEKN